jgi:putative CRISPR-associated protein (TIGR02619 family)
MQRTLFVLSPCGTSLLTNQAGADERRLVSRFANAKYEAQVLGEEREALHALVQRVEEKIVGADLSSARKMSAELNGLIEIYTGNLKTASPSDHHLLLCTDTWLGSETARLIAQWLRAHGLRVEIRKQTDLQTADLVPFQLALTEIVTWCAETLPGYRRQGYHIVFNLTGGFKSVQGFLQTLAMFYADESVYIFESGDALLRIPRLPIELNAVSIARQHLQTFRRLSLQMPVLALDSVPETLIYGYRDDAILSAWGELVWRQAIDVIYAEAILPPPSPRLKFGPKFEKSVAELPPNRRVEVNKQIDGLCRVLELGEKYNLRSLDFKRLKGNPLPPSTWECDAWADEDARRLFGHYEGDAYVLDLLGRALH